MSTALPTLSLFNTLTRKVETVTTVEPGVVRIYNCGPTVYNFAHIGNLRTFLFQDLLRRTLLALGYQVLFCLNVTDVEDKIIQHSQAELPASASNEARHAAMRELTDRYTASFLEDMRATHIEPPTFMPRATEYIGRIIDFVRKLEEKGFAYAKDGSVYYRIAALPDYGKLALLDKKGMQSGASGVDVTEFEKEAVEDFVLWKAAKLGEPYWDSPWGRGRPGWHIECSAMGIERLGERVDIHTGGVDLIFPHHTNEIAQSDGCLGHPWVTLWCHGEFLLVDGQKMSKSLGNFYILPDLRARGVDPLVFRYAIQSNHYRKVLNFTFEGLRAAEASLNRVRAFRRRLETPGSAGEALGEALLARVAAARRSFWAALCDDLNTPEALAALFTLINDLNCEDDRSPFNNAERREVLQFLDETNAVFGTWAHVPDDLDEEIERLIAERQAARKSKDFAASDRIRDMLKAQGIVLEDRKDGTVSWRRA